MKKILLASLMALTLFGCQKSGQPDEESIDPNKKQKVTFTMTSLMAGNGNSNTVYPDTSKKYANYLYYRIYKADGTYLNGATQNYTSANFGTVTDSLTAGTYQVFVAASMGQMMLSENSVPYAQAKFGVFGNLINTWNDTYSKVFKLTVSKTEVSQSVKLERAVAAFEVVLDDIVPPDAYLLSVTVKPAVKSLTLEGAVKDVPDNAEHYYSFQITAADRVKKGKIMTGFFAAGTSPAQVTISAYNYNGGQIAKTVISNVTFEKNKKTTITGSILPGTPTESFKVVINPIWAGNNNISF